MQTKGATKRVERIGGGKIRGSTIADADDQSECILS